VQTRVIQTRVGAVPVWSDFEAHDPARPLILVIRGALPQPHDLEWLRPAGADIAFLHLPSFHSPALINTSVGITIHAFDQVIATEFSDRRIILMGVSSGALPAAGLRSPQIVGRVLVEPFFSTAKLWALAEYLRVLVPADQTTIWSWFSEVLGISLTGQEERDFRHLPAPGLPLHVVIGDEPLMPRRPMRVLPSLTDEADRQLLLSMGARISVVPGGHEVPRNDPAALTAALEEMIREVGER
jgi:hypothetical protein